MAVFLSIVWAAGLAVFLFGLQFLAMAPLTLVYELWKYRFFRRHGSDHTPFVSVIIPAYNEECSIVSSVESVLASAYPSFEVIVINDGSTDRTEEFLGPLIVSGRIRYFRKANGGKASALNLGIALATGEIVFYTDADSLFQPETIGKIARWFVDSRIHAVCGNDTPLKPETPLQKILTVTTHIGTGFVRRAFSVLNIIPIISGNSGAVRKEYLEKVGGFSEIWGEDLDLTFKLQRIGARIIYDSDALVECDVPAGISALWRQRVRWTRSYIRIAALHKDMMFRRQYAPFSWYLPVNWFSLIVIPVIQVVTLMFLPFLAIHGSIVSVDVLDIIAFLGFGSFLAVAAFSVLLDRRPRHLVHLILYGWLIIPLSYFYNSVVLHSLYCEVRRRSERWDKIERREFAGLQASRRSAAQHAWGWGVQLFALAGIAAFLLTGRIDSFDRTVPLNPALHASLTLATHFDAWTNPSDAIGSIFARKQADAVSRVAIGAGRYEWNFFAWRGHEDTWSNDQRIYRGDLFADAVRSVQRKGRRSVAIVDLYAPLYIEHHPQMAARDGDGLASTEQVCFTDLVAGEYGKRLKEMVIYLARSYDIDGISLTELAYQRFCYDDRCLRSFNQVTGETGWPRRFLTGGIDRDNRTIGIWRSTLLARYLHDIADSVHAYGKKLYLDVPIDYTHLAREGLASGLFYPGLLQFADALIVWDYFYLEERSPRSSEDVARFFVDRYGPERIILSIGLWGKEKPVNAGELSDAISSSLLGGAQNLWITPNHMVTQTHWEGIVKSIGSDPGVTAAKVRPDGGKQRSIPGPDKRGGTE
jgi:cellulose synthase/poly-beta-1,6-N-acetylglucosamine synthase-like glycosyltransferase